MKHPIVLSCGSVVDASQYSAVRVVPLVLDSRRRVTEFLAQASVATHFAVVLFRPNASWDVFECYSIDPANPGSSLDDIGETATKVAAILAAASPGPRSLWQRLLDLAAQYIGGPFCDWTGMASWTVRMCRRTGRTEERKGRTDSGDPIWEPVTLPINPVSLPRIVVVGSAAPKETEHAQH